MYTIEHTVGRLLEVRIVSPIAIEEMEGFKRGLRDRLSTMPDKVVICTDLTAARIFPPAVAEAFGAIMRGDNPRLEWSVFLINESALFGLQMERLIKDAGSPVRRAFRDPVEATAFLAPHLNPAERARLAAFVAQA